MLRPVSWEYSAIAANDRRTGQHRACPQQQDRQHTMAYPTDLAWVGNLTERLNQRQRDRRGGLAVERDIRLIEGGDDRGHLRRGHGIPDVIKDLDTPMITPDPCPSLHRSQRVAAAQLPLIATLPPPCPAR